jgi:hypothetical protein
MEKTHYKISLRKTVWAPNTSASLQTILAAEARLTEGQYLLEEQTLNKSKVSDLPSRVLEGQPFPKPKGRL